MQRVSFIVAVTKASVMDGFSGSRLCMQECYRPQGMMKDTPCVYRQKSAVNVVTDGNKFLPQVALCEGQNIPPRAVILDGSQNTSVREANM